MGYRQAVDRPGVDETNPSLDSECQTKDNIILVPRIVSMWQVRTLWSAHTGELAHWFRP